MGSTLEGVVLVHGRGVRLFVRKVGPSLNTTVVAELARSTDTSRLSVGGEDQRRERERETMVRDRNGMGHTCRDTQPWHCMHREREKEKGRK